MTAEHLYHAKLNRLYLKISRTSLNSFSLYSVINFVYESRGEFLKILRTYKYGLSISEFSEHTGFSENELLRIEDGTAFLPTQLFLELCEELAEPSEIQALYSEIRLLLKRSCINRRHLMIIETGLIYNGIKIPYLNSPDQICR